MRARIVTLLITVLLIFILSACVAASPPARATATVALTRAATAIAPEPTETNTIVTATSVPPTTRPSPTMASTPTPTATPGDLSAQATAVTVIANAETLEPVQAAVTDLRQRFEISASATVKILSVEEVEWSDTSLGCPQPEMMYAQVITPGYLVILEASGREYEYHTNKIDKVVLCEEGIPVSSGAKDSDKTVTDGSPNQPKEGGEVDLNRVTPLSNKP